MQQQYVICNKFCWLVNWSHFIHEIDWIDISMYHFIRSNEYLMSELRNHMGRIFIILLFITCTYYSDRIQDEIEKNEKEIDVKIKIWD